MNGQLPSSVSRPTVVHFVCTGNIYRSRLAEAYLRARQLPDLVVISSGVEAVPTRAPYISPVAASILERTALSRFASLFPIHTTRALLEGSDIVVCMARDHHAVCTALLGDLARPLEVWQVKDLNEFVFESATGSAEYEREIMQTAFETFGLITRRVDDFVARLPARQSMRPGGAGARRG